MKRNCSNLPLSWGAGFSPQERRTARAAWALPRQSADPQPCGLKSALRSRSAARRVLLATVALMAGLVWLAAAHGLQAQTTPTFTRITTGPLVTDLGSSFGGAVVDYDGDGYLDLFVNRYLSGRSSLYHNNGDGTFASVTNDLFPVSRGQYSWGFWADFDNNGGADLFMTDGYGVYPSYFAFNNGGGSFTKTDFEIQSAWGISMVDYDQDGRLDLYLIAGETVRTNRFYRNLDGRSFQALTRDEVGDLLSLAPTYGSAAWADYDDDGRPDVFAASLANHNQCQMYHNEGGGRFASVVNDVTFDAVSGTTAGWGDYDNDGRADLCVGALAGTSYVYRNLGDGNFERASIGVTLPRTAAMAWGDYDNDGFIDLLMTWGPNRGCSLFRNNGNGTFTQITSGPIVTTVPPQAGCYSGNWFDYDNNGFLDLFVANGNDSGDKQLANFLFRNEGNSNAWLKVKLAGSVSNRDAVGAKVRVKANFAGATHWQRRDMAAGDNFGGNNNPIAHFGLGDATNVETLRIEWPSGQVTELHNVAVRQSLTIAEPPAFTQVTTGLLATDLGNSTYAGIGDYDGNGSLDVLVHRYLSGQSTLYHNNGNGTFSSITNGLFPLSLGWAGSVWADFDNDGRLDLFMLDYNGSGPSFLAFNNGDGSFTKAGFETQWPWSISAVDYNQDGLLDLYLTRGPGSVTTNRLYRNLDGRTFRTVTRAEVGDLLDLAPAGNIAWADYDDDGRFDVFAPGITNLGGIDYPRCQMYHNEGNGRFASVANQVTLDAINSVCAAWGDYDNDGRVDLCVMGFPWSDFSGWTSFIYRNLGGGQFERASIGLDLGSGGTAAWGDYDNDGFLDLLTTKARDRGCSLFRNNGNGTFTRITNGPIVTNVPLPTWSYTAGWFDYDNDGFLEVFVANGDDRGTAAVGNYLYHNGTNANAWLKVKLVGTVSNRDGAGAKVRLKATFGGATQWQRREIADGEVWGGNNNPIAHFGLGDATNVETLRVEWPLGQVTELHNLSVRQSLTITEAPGLRAIGLAQGAMQMQLTAHTGMNVSMEVSSNLVNWVSWQTVPQTNRTVIVTDPEAGQHPQRFYKARVQ